jgi:hypothetical protein
MRRYPQVHPNILFEFSRARTAARFAQQAMLAPPVHVRTGLGAEAAYSASPSPEDLEV